MTIRAAIAGREMVIAFPPHLAAGMLPLLKSENEEERLVHARALRVALLALAGKEIPL